MSGMHSRVAGWVMMMLLGVGVPPALSQPQPRNAPVIRIGQTVSGSLVRTDPMLDGRGRFKAYRFDAREGNRYVIAMRSADFDAYVSVMRNVGGLTEVLASDDDGGEGTNARLRFRAPSTGTFLIVAQSLGVEGLGAYQLQLEDAPAPAEARPTVIQLGQTLQGTIDERSPVLEDEDDMPYQLYSFTAQGQRVRITLRSEDFDAYLTVLRRVGDTVEQVARDDDSGGGRDARVTLTANGEYLIHARPLHTSGLGTYRLTLEEAPVVVSRPRSIRLGQTVRGELTDSDPELDDGPYYHDWTYTARRGERMRITLRSQDFDAVLAWGRIENGEFSTLAWDDDGAGGTDSLLEVTAPENGTYTIRASSLSAGRTGAYTLQFERMR